MITHSQERYSHLLLLTHKLTCINSNTDSLEDSPTNSFTIWTPYLIHNYIEPNSHFVLLSQKIACVTSFTHSLAHYWSFHSLIHWLVGSLTLQTHNPISNSHKFMDISSSSSSSRGHYFMHMSWKTPHSWPVRARHVVSFMSANLTEVFVVVIIVHSALLYNV